MTDGNGAETAAVEQRAELAEELTADLDDGRHYAGLGYREIDGERRLVEVVWNHEIDQGGVGYPRDDFTDLEDSQEHRALAVEKVGEPDDPTEQTRLFPDGGLDTDETSRRSIAREHLYGATVWAYAAGGASVQTWDHGQYFSKFGGDCGAE